MNNNNMHHYKITVSCNGGMVKKTFSTSQSKSELAKKISSIIEEQAVLTLGGLWVVSPDIVSLDQLD